MAYPLKKRPRITPSTTHLEANNNDFSSIEKEIKYFGLVDLFGNRRNRKNGRHKPEESQIDFSDEPFFTLRIEHRQGGALARHFGEERILLFRSDQRGAIGKVIYSSIPNNYIAEARVHVLSVKDLYRGFDLGGLLFSEAMHCLKNRYYDDAEEKVELNSNCSVRCQLDAEEDIQRHNKLVCFYEQLGCHVNSSKKVVYINNNDGETYRKVPMEIELQYSSPCSRTEETGSLMNFLPVLFLSAVQRRAGLGKENAWLDWLAIETKTGLLQFRSTTGLVLTVESDGSCITQLDNTHDNTMFQLLRVSDDQGTLLEKRKEEEMHCFAEAEAEMRQNELWMMKSVNGLFLTLHPFGHFLFCSPEPSFWQASDSNLSLTCTWDTPDRRQHYKACWAKQTIDYVLLKQERYRPFNICEMPLKEALDLVKTIPGDRFYRGSNTPSLRSLLYRTAELTRVAAYPDWLQLIALIHGIGSVLHLVDSQTVTESEEEDFDWTICSHSRVVGCKAPQDATFYEFRCLNADESDNRYSTELGIYSLHCGLENVLCTWSGPEYVFQMLKHNGVEIPDEGFSILKLFPLGDWHSKNEYKFLSNQEDIDILPFVIDFNQLRLEARRSLYSSTEMDDEVCDTLWKTHYSRIARKYNAFRPLMW